MRDGCTRLLEPCNLPPREPPPPGPFGVHLLTNICREINKKNGAIPTKLGYSKSVDMWSIGTITATLLSGELAFPGPYRSCSNTAFNECVLASAARCDLSFLDDENHDVWSEVGRRPKSFIKKLLVLDERYRMTATEALAHPWLSANPVIQMFTFIYEEWLQDWQPRSEDSQLVESVYPTKNDAHSFLPHEESLTQYSTSRCFTPPRRPSTILGCSSSALPSLRETCDDGHALRRSPHSGNDLRRQYVMNDSMEQLSLGLESGGEYATNYDIQINASPIFPEDSQHQWAGADKLYPFSIPPPPPPILDDEEEVPAIIPETPPRPIKRPRTRAGIDPLHGRPEAGNEAGYSVRDRQSESYFSNELSKRRKLHHRYH